MLNALLVKEQAEFEHLHALSYNVCTGRLVELCWKMVKSSLITTSSTCADLLKSVENALAQVIMVHYSVMLYELQTLR